MDYRQQNLIPEQIPLESSQCGKFENGSWKIQEKEEEPKEKVCKICKRFMDPRYPEDVCFACKEIELFANVKEYIRTEVVNEYMVAEKFNIPLSQVRNWIREGRIQYNKISAKNAIKSTNCQKCGKPIAFGSICTLCLKDLNGNKGYYMGIDELQDKMRFDITN